MAQDRLLKFTDYNVEFKVAEGHYFISLVFNKEWILLKSEYEDLKIVQKDGITYFIAPLSFNINKIYDTIDAIVEYNKEIELKCDLIREKIRDLQELFAVESYERLKCLQFVIKNKKGRPTTKKTTKTAVEIPKSTNLHKKKQRVLDEEENVEEIGIKKPKKIKKKSTNPKLQNVPVEIDREDTNGLDLIENV